MNCTYNLNIAELENYLNTIFDIQSKVRDKEKKLALIEFELKLIEQMTDLLRKHNLHTEGDNARSSIRAGR